jgi:hypothetical protein
LDVAVVNAREGLHLVADLSFAFGAVRDPAEGGNGREELSVGESAVLNHGALVGIKETAQAGKCQELKWRIGPEGREDDALGFPEVIGGSLLFFGTKTAAQESMQGVALAVELSLFGSLGCVSVEQFLFFQDGQEHDAVDQAQNLLVVIADGKLSRQEALAKGLVGRAMPVQETGPQGAEGLFHAHSQTIQGARSLIF